MTPHTSFGTLQRESGLCTGLCTQGQLPVGDGWGGGGPPEGTGLVSGVMKMFHNRPQSWLHISAYIRYQKQNKAETHLNYTS